MLCNKCQIRNATVHWTIENGDDSQGVKKLDLCEECLKGVPFFEEERSIHAALEEGCQYCGDKPGGKASACGFAPFPMLRGGPIKFMCSSCADEYNRILEQKFPRLFNHTLTSGEGAMLISEYKSSRDFPAVLAELDEHMKQWLAKKKSP
jgi:protein-arginine kinase activator protein McsA